MEVCGYFYNPNIQPRGEYEKRRQAVEKLSRLMDIEVIFGDGEAEDYDASGFVTDSNGRAIKTLKRKKDAVTVTVYALRPSPEKPLLGVLITFLHLYFTPNIKTMN